MTKHTKLKPRKLSLTYITEKYANNPTECIHFFFNCKWPGGFFCEKCGCVHYYALKGNIYECKKCGHHHYLYAGIVFQDNKLDPYKLILGLYLFFSTNKGISAIEMSNHLNVNYKTALKLCRKCRALMAISNSEKILNSFYYEADTIYIGAKTDNKPRNVNRTTTSICDFIN